MKKIVSLILSLSFVFALGLSPFSAQSADGLYMVTIACPQGYINYAEENVSRFVVGTGDDIDFSSLEVGSPFSFAQQGSDIYYFPILIDGVITYLLRVYPSGSGTYDAVISSFLAEELESLAPLTSQNNPMRLVMDGSRIVAIIGADEYTLFTYPTNTVAASAVSMASFDNEYVTVNAKQEINVTVNAIQSRSRQYMFFGLDISETQGNNSWCAAYAAAAILRSIGVSGPVGSPVARDIMEWIHGEDVSSFDTAGEENLLNYAADVWDVYPSYVHDTMNQEFLISQLNDGWPVYWRMVRTGGSHAVVLRGYDLRSSVWSIWNPWFSFFESMSMGGTYVPTGYSSSIYTFTYDETICNWVVE